MGLVQAEADSQEEQRSVALDGVTVVWDANIERLSAQYGRLFIDYVSSYFGPRLLVGFDGVSC
jgi:hypothetical protein